MTTPRRAIALALMIIAPILWSTAGVVTRHIQSASAFEMVFWRSLFAALFVLAALLFVQKKNPWQAARAAGWRGMVSGALWGVMFTAFVVALSLTSTANTLVVMSIGPLLTALLARAVLDEPVALRTWLAAGAAAVGIAWMFGASFSSLGPRDLAGMLVALLIPVAAAANVINLRAAAARVDLVPAVMLGGFLSCFLALPFAVPFSATGRDLALLAFLGFFQLGLPCMLVVVASRSLLAPEIALIGLLEVVLGPLWAWIGADERPATATLVGGAVVLVALICNEVPGFRRRRPRAFSNVPGTTRSTSSAGPGSNQ
jgi:drug/metabolite transporter (DMT)-like permease